MEELIEELTKVSPSNLSEEGLKLFNKINEIIDRNGELEQESKASKLSINILTNKLEKVVEENTAKLKEKMEERDSIGMIIELIINERDYYKKLASAYQGECISKSKVKEKIEELKQEIEQIRNETGVTWDNELYVNQTKIDVLNELLEEE